MVAMGDLRKNILGSERSTLIGTTNRDQSCYLTCKECLQRLRIIDGFTLLRSFSKRKGVATPNAGVAKKRDQKGLLEVE